MHRLLIPLAILAATAFNPAHADSDREVRVPLLAAYKQECGACHTAYAPGLLPVASWARLMDTLPRHFGADASLDAAMLKTLQTWLAHNAGTRRRAQEAQEAQEAPPEDRITRAPRFVREHRELAPEVWQRAAVGNASNCGACHTQADAGRYSEHDVRIPR